MCFCKRLLYSLSYHHRHHPEEINHALWCNHVVGCEHFQPAPPPPRKSLPLNLKAALKQTLAASEQILRFLNFAKKHSTMDQSCDGDSPPQHRPLLAVTSRRGQTCSTISVASMWLERPLLQPWLQQHSTRRCTNSPAEDQEVARRDASRVPLDISSNETSADKWHMPPKSLKMVVKCRASSLTECVPGHW